MFRQADSYLRQLTETGSELPADYLLTFQRLESVSLDSAKFLPVIRTFDISKAHGRDDVRDRELSE